VAIRPGQWTPPAHPPMGEMARLGGATASAVSQNGRASPSSPSPRTRSRSDRHRGKVSRDGTPKDQAGNQIRHRDDGPHQGAAVDA